MRHFKNDTLGTGPGAAACGRLAWATLMVLSGMLTDFASLFVVVAFVVYISRHKEPAEVGSPFPRRAVVVLVIVGAVLAVMLDCL